MSIADAESRSKHMRLPESDVFGNNRNSVNGIRKFARARRAQTTSVPTIAPELRVGPGLLAHYLTDTRPVPRTSTTARSTTSTRPPSKIVC